MGVREREEWKGKVEEKVWDKVVEPAKTPEPAKKPYPNNVPVLNPIPA